MTRSPFSQEDNRRPAQSVHGDHLRVVSIEGCNNPGVSSGVLHYDGIRGSIHPEFRGADSVMTKDAEQRSGLTGEVLINQKLHDARSRGIMKSFRLAAAKVKAC